jgi:hypothetical protein
VIKTAGVGWSASWWGNKQGALKSSFLSYYLIPFSSVTYQILHSYLSSSSLIPLECLSPTTSSIQSLYHPEFAMYLCLSWQFCVLPLLLGILIVLEIKIHDIHSYFLTSRDLSLWWCSFWVSLRGTQKWSMSRTFSLQVKVQIPYPKSCMHARARTHTHTHTQMPCPGDGNTPHSNGNVTTNLAVPSWYATAD